MLAFGFESFANTDKRSRKSSKWKTGVVCDMPQLPETEIARTLKERLNEHRKQNVGCHSIDWQKVKVIQQEIDVQRKTSEAFTTHLRHLSRDRRYDLTPVHNHIT